MGSWLSVMRSLRAPAETTPTFKQDHAISQALDPENIMPESLP
jgi:hypothetical protein